MKNLLFISMLLFSFACHDSHQLMDVEEEFEDLMEMPSTHLSVPSERVNEEISKKVVKTGGIEFESSSVTKDYKIIQRLLSKYDAYIESENQSKSSQRIDYNLTIRVHAQGYDTLYSSISGLGIRLEHKYSNLEDVTARYYDLKTRIKNKSALEQRYVQLLKKASAIKDILEIEKKLNELRTDIEYLQGQFNYLSQQVSLSTINVSFYEVLPYVYDSSPRNGFGARILHSLNKGWLGFLSFLVGLTGIWPFVLLTILGIYLFRKFWTRRRQ